MKRFFISAIYEVGKQNNATGFWYQQLLQLPLESAIDIYVQERKEKRNIEDADVFIAAFCIHNNHILVTDNAKHFENIKGLHTVNWRYP